MISLRLAYHISKTAVTTCNYFWYHNAAMPCNSIISRIINVKCWFIPTLIYLVGLQVIHEYAPSSQSAVYKA